MVCGDTILSLSCCRLYAGLIFFVITLLKRYVHEHFLHVRYYVLDTMGHSGNLWLFSGYSVILLDTFWIKHEGEGIGGQV